MAFTPTLRSLMVDVMNLYHFIEHLFAGSPTPNIPGMITRVDGKTCVPDCLTPRVDNLDELPYPDYTDYYAQQRAAPLFPTTASGTR